MTAFVNEDVSYSSGRGNSTGDPGPSGEWMTYAMGDLGLLSGSVASWFRVLGLFDFK